MSDFRTYITQTGFGLERDAKFNNTHVDLSVLVVGDGVLSDSASPAERTDLVNQVREYAITIEKDELDPIVWIARAEIPTSDGGFFIKEAGIKTKDGYLYAYARQAGDYKPLLEEGQGKSYTIRLKFVPGNADAIQLKIDPSVQFATPTDLENAVKAHLDAEDPHPQYETDVGASTKANNALSTAKAYADSKASSALSSAKNYADEKLEESSVPVSAVIWVASITAPTGFLKANGAAVSRTSYAALYSKIGTTFGAGNGSTTFNVPDLRGEFIRGFDDGRGVDIDRAFGSLQEDAIRNITGRAGSFRTQGGASASGALYVSNAGGDNAGDGDDGNTYHVYIDASRVVPTADDNRPRNIALTACIKY